MQLEDIYYFARKKQDHREIFDLADGVVRVSSQDQDDSAEIDRRLTLLAGVPDPNGEQRRKAVDFLAELVTFDKLNSQSLQPHWVPEQQIPMPDIKYEQDGQQVPVEVKHLNPPRDEDIALSTGNTHGGSVDFDYDLGLQRKLEDFVTSARTKFTHFNQQVNGRDSTSGVLYLFFSKSIDADISDRIEWQQNMEDRIRDIVQPLVGDDIELVLVDFESCFPRS